MNEVIREPYISEIWRYPLKGAAGEMLQSATIGVRGIDGDRLFMIADAATGHFISGKTDPKVSLVSACLQDDLLVVGIPLDGAGESKEYFCISTARSGERVEVTLPGNNKHPGLHMGGGIEPALSDYFHRQVQLIRIPDDYEREVTPAWAGPGQQTGYADSAPMHLVSASSIEDFGGRIKQHLDIRRFRPGLVVASLKPWAEDAMRLIRAQDVEMRFGKPTVRCEVPGINPDTGEVDLDFLAALARYHRVNGRDGNRAKGANMGWSLTVTEGQIAVNDPIEILEQAV